MRLGLLGVSVLAAALLAGCDERGGADAAAFDVADYPVRPITIVSWVNPGSPTDLLARAIARSGERHFGQRIRVLNRPGGGGALAMSYLLSQPPDGHTLAIMTTSGVVNLALGHVPYRPEDFRYIARIQIDPYLVAVRRESPFRDLEGFFAHAHENPGALSISGFGVASGHFLAFSRLREEAGGPDVRWIAYEGSSDAAVALLGGHVDAANVNYNPIREHLRTGAVRVLGGSAPLPALPEVRTYREQGFDVDAVQWRGVMAPADMDEALVRRIRELVEKTVAEPDFREFMEQAATEYGLMEGPDELQSWVLQEAKDTREMMSALGLVSARGGSPR